MTYSGHAAVTAARFVGLLICILLALPAVATDTNWLRHLAVQRTAEYVRIGTSAPPGETSAAVQFFSDILLHEGISFETVETAPGRVNIWARLPAAPGGRNNPALLLLHHMDTPPAAAERWKRRPLSGEVTDDRIHGRGTLGNKGLGIMQLQSFIALHRAGLPLNRDVIFMATADRYDGGEKGLGWLVEHLPELFREVGFALSGGGYGVTTDERTLFHVEAGTKAPLWLQLRTRNVLGNQNAAERLLDGLQQVRAYEFPLEVAPPVANYFAAMAPYQPSEWKDAFADISAVIEDEQLFAEFDRVYPQYRDLLRNTCAIVSINVGYGMALADGAGARVECSLLMHQNPQRVIDDLGEALEDFGIELETVLSYPSGMSTTDSAAYQALKNALEGEGRNHHVVPAIGAEANDHHFLRELGIEVYGVVPLTVTEAELATITGPDESISRTDLRQGTLLLYELLKTLVHD